MSCISLSGKIGIGLLTIHLLTISLRLLPITHWLLTITNRLLTITQRLLLLRKHLIQILLESLLLRVEICYCIKILERLEVEVWGLSISR